MNPLFLSFAKLLWFLLLSKSNWRFTAVIYLIIWSSHSGGVYNWSFAKKTSIAILQRLPSQNLRHNTQYCHRFDCLHLIIVTFLPGRIGLGIDNRTPWLYVLHLHFPHIRYCLLYTS